ncbi:hypothetical protein Tco_1285952 [Tanacetum coccineum]
MLGCQTSLGMFLVLVIWSLSKHFLKETMYMSLRIYIALLPTIAYVGDQQQMPSTSTNHADASSVSNPPHVGDVLDSRDTSLPGQQKQEISNGIGSCRFMTGDGIYFYE